MFKQQEEDAKPNSRICSGHFTDGDVKKHPVPTLGKYFASPMKKGLRLDRARDRRGETTEGAEQEIYDGMQ